ncbi:MAG TPA: serine/threonine-protein kinase, partial [Kofleriaceae bacterium]|nr:serine/threonine-protein kinase [Kofleriaceae bacterium]
RSRTWREVLDVCLAAGRGLAAAHKSGIVHRDVKPANVLCGRDGWVRVTDFGVAALLDDVRSTGAGEELVSGTAGYMSPEQMEGRSIDGRSDQFGFCVTAWEALTGGRPFGGTTLPAVWHAVNSGQEPVPPAGTMPARVRRVLLRGLHRDPAQRFESMDELLTALGGAGRGRRRWVGRGAVAAAVAAAALVGAVTAGGRGDEPGTCAGAEERLSEVWNADRRAAVEHVFSAGGFDDAAATARRFTGAVDQRATGWVAARTAACRATRVTGEQSEQVLDARMECLDDQLRSLDSLVSGVAAGGGSLFAALDAAHSLPDAELCSATSMRSRGVPASFADDPVAREQAAQVDLLLARARVDISMMDAEGATEALDAAAPLVAALPDPIRHARLAFERARAAEAAHDFDGAKAAFNEAAGVAARAGAQRIVAEVAARMTFLVGVQQQRPRDAEAWGAAAELELSRGSGDDWLRGFLDLTRGQMAYQARDFKGALVLAGRALERYRQAGSGGDAPGVLSAMRVQASATEDLGDRARAAEIRRQALALAQQTYGPDHPQVASILTLIARADTDAGDLAAARSGFERALAIREKALGPSHPLVSESLGDLGILAAEQGDVVAAEEHLRRWLATEEQAALGGAHLAAPLVNLASLLHDTNRNAEARELLERAVAVYEEARGPDFAGLVAPLLELAEIDEEERGCAWARPRLDRALAIADDPAEPDPTVSWVLIPLALCEIETGSAEKALEMARRAGAMREAAGMPESMLAETRFAEAHALAAAGRHAEAKGVAAAARRGASPELAASIDQWLSKKTRRR